MPIKDMLITLLFGYPPPPEMVDARFPVFLQRSAGLLLTLLITVLSLAIGLVIGIALALCRREQAGDRRSGALVRLLSSAFRSLAVVVTEGVRGLPIMLLVLLTFYLPFRLFELRLPSFILATVVFSLYAGVYLSEIIRAGFRSIDLEWRHASRVLGLSRRQSLLKIELPLVCRHMLPDLRNLAVTVFKDTSTLAVVAVPELTYIARQMLISEPVNYSLVWLMVLTFYWLIATLMSAWPKPNP
jgi:His/Glu/Gln/Arg/opine family amino acid ABC transporter permease subunit